VRRSTVAWALNTAEMVQPRRLLHGRHQERLCRILPHHQPQPPGIRLRLRRTSTTRAQCRILPNANPPQQPDDRRSAGEGRLRREQLCCSPAVPAAKARGQVTAELRGRQPRGPAPPGLALVSGAGRRRPARDRAARATPLGQDPLPGPRAGAGSAGPRSSSSRDVHRVPSPMVRDL